MDYQTVMQHVDYGRGKAGEILGPPCDVFRVQANGATNYLDTANRVAQGQRIARRITAKKEDIEAPQMGSLFYKMLMDASLYETGDVFIERDTAYGQGSTEVDFTSDEFEAYCLAYHAPLKNTICVRLDRTASFWRPQSGPDSSGYWSATLSAATMAPVVLDDGEWSVGAVGSPASLIPIGMQSTHRTHGELFKGLPSGTNLTQWFVYVPPLNGYIPREGDRILTDGATMSAGSRYVVLHPYMQQAGLQGSQLVCAREIARAG